MDAPTILAVDDEPDMLENYARLLERDGYRCLRALSGLEAIGVIDRERLALVITDLHLPGVGGLEVARHARRCAPALPVLLVTANARAGRLAHAAGDVTATIAKPFDGAALLGLVRQMLSPPTAAPRGHDGPA